MQIGPQQKKILHFIMKTSQRKKLKYKRGVGQMLTKADEGGRGGVQEPLILAEVLREQPLIPNAGSEENKGRKIDEGK